MKGIFRMTVFAAVSVLGLVVRAGYDTPEIKVFRDDNPLEDNPSKGIVLEFTDDSGVKKDDHYFFGDKKRPDDGSLRYHTEMGVENGFTMGKKDDTIALFDYSKKFKRVDAIVADTPKWGGEYLNTRLEFEAGLREEGGFEASILTFKNKKDKSGNTNETEIKVIGVGIGAAATQYVRGEWKNTILLIPVSLEGEAGFSEGAKASAEGSVKIDWKTGEIVVVLGASAVAGYGGETNVTVKVGVGEGASKVFGKVIEGVTGMSDEYIKKLNEADSIDEMLKLMMDKAGIDEKDRDEIFGLLKQGAHTATAIRAINAKDGAHWWNDGEERYRKLLQEMREQAKNAADADGGDVDPFNSEPENDGNGKMCPVPGNGSTDRGSTGGQSPSKPTTRRRGGSGGGDTRAKIW